MQVLDERIRAVKTIVRPIKHSIERHVLFPKDYVSLTRIKNRIKKKDLNHQGINVIFLVQFPEMWNSQRSVYEAFKHDNHYNVVILAVPKQKGAMQDLNEYESVNASVLFCQEYGFSYVDAKSSDSWFDINKLDPDVIFLQRPYDENMPAHLSMRVLRKRSVLCYIPYGYEFVNNVHLDIEYNQNLINNVFCCFAENDETYRYIRNRSRLDCRMGLRKVYNVGYPRFDLISSERGNSNKRYRFLWTPRWSVSEKNDRSYFLDYYDVLIRYFSSNKDKYLTIRPHPLMFKNFLEKGVMSQQEIEKCKLTIQKMPNVKWDTNEDYLVTFSKVDVLISDFSTIIVDFFITNKPIVYCGGNVGSFNSIGKRMAEGLYHVSNENELIQTIEYLSNNDDKFFEMNAETIRKCFKNKRSIGLRVKESVIDFIHS